jgi:hypothetical protein
MTDWQEIARQANQRAHDLDLEVGELRARLDDDGMTAMSYLQRRVDSQRKALDRLNRKVLSQRFRLRLLQSLGRDVTREEYLAAREALGNERVADYEALV